MRILINQKRHKSRRTKRDKLSFTRSFIKHATDPMSSDETHRATNTDRCSLMINNRASLLLTSSSKTQRHRCTLERKKRAAGFRRARIGTRPRLSLRAKTSRAMSFVFFGYFVRLVTTRGPTRGRAGFNLEIESSMPTRAFCLWFSPYLVS